MDNADAHHVWLLLLCCLSDGYCFDWWTLYQKNDDQQTEKIVINLDFKKHTTHVIL